MDALIPALRFSPNNNHPSYILTIHKSSGNSRKNPQTHKFTYTGPFPSRKVLQGLKRRAQQVFHVRPDSYALSIAMPRPGPRSEPFIIRIDSLKTFDDIADAFRLRTSHFYRDDSGRFCLNFWLDSKDSTLTQLFLPHDAKQRADKLRSLKRKVHLANNLCHADRRLRNQLEKDVQEPLGTAFIRPPSPPSQANENISDELSTPMFERLQKAVSAQLDTLSTAESHHISQELSQSPTPEFPDPSDEVSDKTSACHSKMRACSPCTPFTGDLTVASENPSQTSAEQADYLAKIGLLPTEDQTSNWYEILINAFADDSRFVVSPQTQSDLLSLHVYYLNDEREANLVFMAQVHPVNLLQIPSMRQQADVQMRTFLSEHISQVALPKFHAINVCGTTMSFYMVDCHTGLIFPQRAHGSSLDDLLPSNHLLNLWSCELGTPTGDETITSLIAEIRLMVKKAQKVNTIPRYPGSVEQAHGSYNHLSSLGSLNAVIRDTFPPGRYRIVPLWNKRHTIHGVTFAMLCLVIQDLQLGPILIVQHAPDLGTAAFHYKCDQLMRETIRGMAPACKTVKLHGISFLKNQARFYMLDTITRLFTPSMVPVELVDRVLPQNYLLGAWDLKLQDNDCLEKIQIIATDSREMIPTYDFAPQPKVDTKHQVDSSNSPSSGTLSKTPAPCPVICNACLRIVVGLRAKCTHETCPDFNLCASCYERIRDIHPGHSFRVMIQVNQFISPGSTIQPSSSSCDRCHHVMKRPAATSSTSPGCDLCLECRAHSEKSSTSLNNLRCIESLKDSISSKVIPESRDGIPEEDTPIVVSCTLFGSVPSRALIKCDGCSKTLSSFRAKCSHAECPDYDLCSKCYRDRSGLHPGDHSFELFEIVVDADGYVTSCRSSSRGLEFVESPKAFSPVQTVKESDAGIHGETSPMVVSCTVSTPPPAMPLHVQIKCDGCSKTLNSFRAKCTHAECPDFDLCAECYDVRLGLHPRGHSFQLFQLTVDARGAVTSCLLHDDMFHSTGQPLSISDKSHSANCDMCTKRISGVRWKCLDCVDWDCCEQCRPNVSAVHPFHRLVSITDPTLLAPELPAQHLKKHSGVICAWCNYTIRGVRYKCSHPDCPDFDLCSRCESSPIPRHDINHAMLKIRDSQTWRAGISTSKSSSVEQTTTLIRAPIRIGHPVPRPENSLCSNNSAVQDSASVSDQAPLNEIRTGCTIAPPEVSLSKSDSEADDSSSVSGQEFPNTIRIGHAVARPEPSLSNSDSKTEDVSNSDSNTEDVSNSDSKTEDVAPSVSAQEPSSQAPRNYFEAPSVSQFESIPGEPLSSYQFDSFAQGVDKSSLSNVPKVACEPSNMALIIDGSSANGLPGAFPDDASAAGCIEASGHSSTMLPIVDSSTTPESSMIQVLKSGGHQDNESRPFYGSSFVSDLNLPDGTCVSAGARFSKVWLVQNTGSQQWPVGTQIFLNGGFQHLLQESFPVPAALPNELVEVTIETTAPEESGGYMQVWRLVRPDGNKFGDRLWINLQVIGEDQLDIEDPSSSALSASVGFLLPHISNRPSDDSHSVSNSNPSSQHQASNCDKEAPLSADSQNHHDGDGDGDGADLAQSPSHLSSAADFDDYEFTSEPESENDNDEFELVTDSDPLSE